MKLADLKTKIFADGAELDGMLAMYREPHIKGFTTNPTLMRKAGITDYRAFAKQVLAAIPDRPISFEVFSDEFASAGRRSGIDPLLLLALARQESLFDANARSPAGARGLMQLMPGTASALGVSDVFDPAQNLDGGARHLGELVTRYGGDLSKALAAYNAGAGAVARHGGVPPYRETRAYVRRVLERYRAKKAKEP